MNDTDDISQIFQLVDSDGSGYLNKEKLQLVCPHLSPSEIEVIFNDLDTNHDDRICLKEFTQGFRDLIQPKENRSSLKQTKSLNQDELDEENLTTNQINQVLNNLSW